MTAFGELVIVIVVAVAGGFLAHMLRQPVIVGFIAAGLVIGYFERLELAHLPFIESLGAIGVALLLFLVGLEMNVKEWRKTSGLALVAGAGQIIFTFGLGYLISIALKFTPIAAFYIATALTLSSTIIVVKLLSEKKDLKSLYGQVAIAILLLQDFAAILILLFLGGLVTDGLSYSFQGLTALYKLAGLILFVILASQVLPKVLGAVSRSSEMLYLFSIAWALGVSALAVQVGVGIEAGGFLAGLALANSSEHFRIAARLRSLRDFFVILFFVVLGIRALEGLGGVPVIPAGILTLFVLVGTPIIMLLVMGALGYRPRTSFLTGLAIAQVSEFGFIIAATGNRLGHIGASETALITMVGLATIFVSSYFIVHNRYFYEVFRPLLRRLELRRNLVEEIPPETEFKNHVILIGVHRMGHGILEALSDSKTDFVALDFDPTVVKTLSRAGAPLIYGDITDSEVQEKAGLARAKVVISTVPELKDNLVILEEAKRKKSKAKLILTAEDERSAQELYKEGADYVILPRFLGGQELARLISEDHKFTSLKELKKRDLKLIGI